MTITQDSPTTYTIGGLAALTGGDGNYTLTVSAAGVSDFFGDVGTRLPVHLLGDGHRRARGRQRRRRQSRPSGTRPWTPSTSSSPSRSSRPRSTTSALSLTLNGGPEPDHAPASPSPRSTPTTYSIGGLGRPDRRRRQLRPDGERRRAGRRLGQLGRRLPLGNLDDEHGRPDRRVAPDLHPVAAQHRRPHDRRDFLRARSSRPRSPTRTSRIPRRAGRT